MFSHAALPLQVFSSCIVLYPRAGTRADCDSYLGHCPLWHQLSQHPNRNNVAAKLCTVVVSNLRRWRRTMLLCARKQNLNSTASSIHKNVGEKKSLHSSTYRFMADTAVTIEKKKQQNKTFQSCLNSILFLTIENQRNQ